MSGSRDGKRAKRGRVLWLWLWWFPAKGHGSWMQLLMGTGRGGLTLRGGGLNVVGQRRLGGQTERVAKDVSSCQPSRLVSRSWADPRQCRHRIWSKPSGSQKTRVGARRLTASKRNRELPVDQLAAYAEVITFGRSICFFGRSHSVRYSSGRRADVEEVGETLYASRASVFHWRSPVVSGADPALRRDLPAAQWFRRPRL